MKWSATLMPRLPLISTRTHTYTYMCMYFVSTRHIDYNNNNNNSNNHHHRTFNNDNNNNNEKIHARTERKKFYKGHVLDANAKNFLRKRKKTWNFSNAYSSHYLRHSFFSNRHFSFFFARAQKQKKNSPIVKKKIFSCEIFINN